MFTLLTGDGGSTSASPKEIFRPEISWLPLIIYLCVIISSSLGLCRNSTSINHVFGRGVWVTLLFEWVARFENAEKNGVKPEQHGEEN